MTTPADRYLPITSGSPMANAIIAAVREEQARIRSWLDGVTDFQRCRAELVPYMLGEVPDDNRVITPFFGERIHRDLLSRMAEMDYYRGRARALNILAEILGVEWSFEKRTNNFGTVIGIDLRVTFSVTPGADVRQVYDQYERMFTALLPILATPAMFLQDEFVILNLDSTVGATGWSMDFLADDDPLEVS